MPCGMRPSNARVCHFTTRAGWTDEIMDFSSYCKVEVTECREPFGKGRTPLTQALRVGLLSRFKPLSPMSTQLISIGASGISVLLGLWFLGSSFGNQGLQRTLQKKQDDIQARQAAIQTQQQELQSQQQLIDAGSQLAQQVGPAMIRDLAALQLDKNNKKIAQLLLKYGIEAKANPAPANAPAPPPKAAPNPPPAPPAAPNPKPQNGGQ